MNRRSRTMPRFGMTFAREDPMAICQQTQRLFESLRATNTGRTDMLCRDVPRK